MAAPKWAVGMEKLGPGIYVKDRELHFSGRELCEYFRVPYNEENCRKLERAALRAIRNTFGQTPPVVSVEDE